MKVTNIIPLNHGQEIYPCLPSCVTIVVNNLNEKKDKKDIRVITARVAIISDTDFLLLLCKTKRYFIIGDLRLIQNESFN